MRKLAIIIVLSSGCIMGCQTYPPVHNIEHQAVVDHSSQQIKAAIIAGATRKGWHVAQVQEGLMKGTLTRRSHQVEVDIPYDENSYSILYKHSENLGYNAQKGIIHPRYNTWIINLNRSINAALKK